MQEKRWSGHVPGDKPWDTEMGSWGTGKVKTLRQMLMFCSKLQRTLSVNCVMILSLLLPSGKFWDAQHLVVKPSGSMTSFFSHQLSNPAVSEIKFFFPYFLLIQYFVLVVSAVVSLDSQITQNPFHIYHQAHGAAVSRISFPSSLENQWCAQLRGDDGFCPIFHVFFKSCWVTFK